MRIDWQIACRGNRLHYRQTDRKVGHEMAVHYVDMKDGRAAAFNCLDLVTQTRKISRQNGWRYVNYPIVHHFGLSSDWSWALAAAAGYLRSCRASSCC